jgi:hypothetical protein
VAITLSPEQRRAFFQAILDVHSAANDSTPVAALALMAAIFEDQLIPARFDENEYEITQTCNLSEMPFSTEKISTIERWMRFHCAPDATCDECGLRMGGNAAVEDLNDLEHRHIFSLTPSGFKSYFICEWCAERYECNPERGFPNCSARTNGINRNRDSKRSAVMSTNVPKGLAAASIEKVNLHKG